MPAPAISHLICTSALLMLILVMPFFYAIIVNNIRVDMIRREMREIADYVSNTLANLYFLTNCTSCDVNMTKELIYLPSAIENSIYILKIEQSGNTASKISAYLKDRSSVAADAWLVPGLKVDSVWNSIESSARTVIAGCGRSGGSIRIWIRYG